MKDFARLVKYVKPYWLVFVAAVIAMFLTAVFETATGALLVPVFDQFMPAAGVKSKTLFDLHSLVPRNDWFKAWIVISGLLLGFTILKGIAEFFSSYLMSKIGQASVLKLRRELYEHLLKQPTPFFDKHRTNFLVSRLVVNCAAIELAVSNNLRDTLRESFMLVCFLSAAFYFNWKLMLGALVLAPIIGFLTARFSKSLRRLSEESVEGNKMLNDTAQEALANHTIVKAYSAEEREKDRFSRVAALIAKANLRSGLLAALSPPIIESVGVVALVIFFYFGLREINTSYMDASQFFTFLFFLFRSYDPMRRLSRQHNEINKAFAAARDVWDILDTDEVLPEKANAVELKPLQHSIRLENVSFTYGKSQKKILQNIDLEITKGSVVALVGESGGGKSSLIKLVQRLYDPTSGTICWDDVDLRDSKQASLKKQIALVTQETVLFNDSVAYNISYGKPDATPQQIALVTQETVLFNDSVAYNISYGKPDATPQQIEDAARIAFADDFINELPQRYDTLVGERGIFLSGGQRQRIAIARAVLVDAPVLILDEATSALDSESELLVQKALANLMKSKTSIVIAHRLSTIRRADKIVVMEKGKIIETGTHAELLAQDGRYRRLYELQFAEEESLLV